MAASKYSVSGIIRNKMKFDIAVNANSEQHARALAIVKIGSTQKLKRNAIRITSVKKG